MEEHISIAKPAADVFAFVADPANLPNWVPQLRRDDADLPRDGLEADDGARSVRWSFEPAGEWHVSGEGEVSTLRLVVHAESATPADPTEDETPAEALAHGLEAALQSVKSHVEGVDGGDPSEPTHDAPSRLYGSTATQDPQI